MMKIAKHEILSVIFGAIVGFGVPFGILFPLLDRTVEEFEGASKNFSCARARYSKRER